MTIRIGLGPLGHPAESERDTKLNEYKRLKQKSQSGALTQSENQKLATLKQELQARNIIDKNGNEIDRRTNIWANREKNYSEYIVDQAKAGFNTSSGLNRAGSIFQSIFNSYNQE